MFDAVRFRSNVALSASAARDPTRLAASLPSPASARTLKNGYMSRWLALEGAAGLAQPRY